MTDLTDRMRTCAARILAITDPERNDASINDAPNLLIEASNALEACTATGAACIPLTDAERRLGEPMEIIPPEAKQREDDFSRDPFLPIDKLREHNPRTCPECDSHAAKRARRLGRKLMLECPGCGAVWEWKPKAEWI